MVGPALRRGCCKGGDGGVLGGSWWRDGDGRVGWEDTVSDYIVLAVGAETAVGRQARDYLSLLIHWKMKYRKRSSKRNKKRNKKRKTKMPVVVRCLGARCDAPNVSASRAPAQTLAVCE